MFRGRDPGIGSEAGGTRGVAPHFRGKVRATPWGRPFLLEASAIFLTFYPSVRLAASWR
jgi:hypothetical protein